MSVLNSVFTVWNDDSLMSFIMSGVGHFRQFINITKLISEILSESNLLLHFFFSLEIALFHIFYCKENRHELHKMSVVHES